MNSLMIFLQGEFSTASHDVADCFTQGARDAGFADTSVAVLDSDKENFAPGEFILPAALFITGIVAKKITEKWVEEFVWPHVRKQIENAEWPKLAACVRTAKPTEPPAEAGSNLPEPR